MIGDAVERKGFWSAARDFLENPEADRLYLSGVAQIRHHSRFGAMHRSRANDLREPLQLRPAFHHPRNARHPLDAGNLLGKAALETSGRIGQHKVNSRLAKACREKSLVNPF